MSKFPEGDKVIEYAQRPLTEALSEGSAKEILKTNIEVLKKQAEALAKANYEKSSKSVECPHCEKKFKVEIPASFDAVARSMAYTTKVVDEIARLMSFIQGGPDSRPDLGLGAIFEALTDEQLAMVQGWVKENKERAIQ